jgi:hypothetical protein
MVELGHVESARPGTPLVNDASHTDVFSFILMKAGWMSGHASSTCLPVQVELGPLIMDQCYGAAVLVYVCPSAPAHQQ